jgi:fluoride exporter
LTFLAQAVFVGIAGSLGSVTRFMLSHFVSRLMGTLFPLGTLLINVSGALLIGFMSALVTRHFLSLTFQVIVATGFLGGYTTFSTMCWETVQLGRADRVRGSIYYLGGNIVLGLLAALFGLLVGWRV